MDKDNNDTIGRSGSSTGPVKPHMGRGGPPRGGDSPMGPGGPSPGFQLAAFSSLKIRSFRWLWFGNFFAFNAMQMQIVARGWLVYAMSDSPLALGIVSAGFGLPMIIFSLFGGTLADRVRKRNLLMTTQSTMAVVTLVITILITIDKIALWHLFGASLATGMIFSFMMPARQAFIVDLVDEKDYLNAISLGSMAMNTCRIASPALAGVLIKFIGIPGVYWIVSISHICVVLTTTRIPPGAHMAARAEAPIMSDILEGLRYVKNNRIIISLLILGFVPMLIVMPYQMLMPVFARDIFKAGETGLGILMSTSGIGALVGSIVIASMGDYQKKGMLMLVTGVFFGLFLIPFALMGSLMSAAVVLMFVGASSSVFMTLNSTLVMSNTPSELIGRVMSVFMWTFGLMPLGTVLGGALAELIGAPYTVAGGGVLLVLFLIGVSTTQPIIRQLK